MPLVCAVIVASALLNEFPFVPVSSLAARMVDARALQLTLAIALVIGWALTAPNGLALKVLRGSDTPTVPTTVLYTIRTLSAPMLETAIAQLGSVCAALVSLVQHVIVLIALKGWRLRMLTAPAFVLAMEDAWTWRL